MLSSMFPPCTAPPAAAFPAAAFPAAFPAAYPAAYPAAFPAAFPQQIPVHPSMLKAEHSASNATRRGPMDEMRQVCLSLVSFPWTLTQTLTQTLTPTQTSTSTPQLTRILIKLFPASSSFLVLNGVPDGRCCFVFCSGVREFGSSGVRKFGSSEVRKFGSSEVRVELEESEDSDLPHPTGPLRFQPHQRGTDPRVPRQLAVARGAEAHVGPSGGLGSLYIE